MWRYRKRSATFIHIKYLTLSQWWFSAYSRKYIFSSWRHTFLWSAGIYMTGCNLFTERKQTQLLISGKQGRLCPLEKNENKDCRGKLFLFIPCNHWHESVCFRLTRNEKVYQIHIETKIGKTYERWLLFVQSRIQAVGTREVVFALRFVWLYPMRMNKKWLFGELSLLSRPLFTNFMMSYDKIRYFIYLNCEAGNPAIDVFNHSQC